FKPASACGIFSCVACHVALAEASVGSRWRASRYNCSRSSAKIGLAATARIAATVTMISVLCILRIISLSAAPLQRPPSPVPFMVRRRGAWYSGSGPSILFHRGIDVLRPRRDAALQIRDVQSEVLAQE